MEIETLKKHSSASQFTTLLLYIAQGLVRRIETFKFTELLILLAAVNLVYAFWALYGVVRYGNETSRPKRQLLSSVLTVLTAGGLFVLIMLM
ncbi:hypothetical protein P0M11_12935 [Kaistella sp. PBT33-4]|uniref:hypothetical protein n=1 Tax=Kaistella sp. PBT33-4 TaxID=3032000 RepID=UPI0023D81BC6|nr:hypothetical protein [Kaistella sp. PBT33-4]MDF0720904.1 hypothetical protein [Kaistella sp. PBT33-4]